MSMKVSVIIPVYNAERYIAKCIESLLNQTIHDCEFIFVNDGSTDRSQSIIEGYESKDSRVILINQPNRGVSAARNRGLRRATGEYVGFVDSDDYVDRDMFETMYTAAATKQLDAVVTNLELELDGTKQLITFPFSTQVLDRSYIQQHILQYMLRSDDFNTVMNKLYKRELILKHNIVFPEHMALGEDGWFNMMVMGQASTVQYLNYCGYHYCEVAGSATHDIANKDYFKQALEVYHMELPRSYLFMEHSEIQRLKAIKLVRNVIAYIHMYLKPETGATFYHKYRYVKQMIDHPDVREALKIFQQLMAATLGRYEQWIVYLMNHRLVLGLYCVTAYSRYRNK